MVCYLMQMLSAYSGTSPSTASMDALRKDVKMDKDPRRIRLKRPESLLYSRRSLCLHRSLCPSPAGVSARPASTSTRPPVTRLGCPDRILSGDKPESPAQPDTPARTDRTLRPEAGLRALMGQRPMYLCPDYLLFTSLPLGRTRPSTPLLVAYI